MSNRILLGIAIFSICTLGMSAEAEATFFIAKTCIDKRGNSVECDPDKRPPAIVKGPQRFHKAWDRRQGDVTLIDMRNGQFRIMYKPKWVENNQGDSFFCSVRLREYTDGWAQREETDLYYFLKIDEAACKNTKALAKQALEYFPFDWFHQKHLVCDNHFVDPCLAAKVTFHEVTKLIAEGHVDDDKLVIVGHEPPNARQRQRLIERPRMSPDTVMPIVHVREYLNMDKVWCARYEKLMLVCKPEKGPIQVMTFQSFSF